MKKLTVGLVCLEWPSAGHSGGVGRYAQRLAAQLATEVDLIVFAFEGARAVSGVRLVELPRPKTRFGRYYFAPFRLRAAVKAHNLDLIHSMGDDWALPRRSVNVVRTFLGSSLNEARSSSGVRRANHYILSITERISARKAAVRVGIGPDSYKAFSCHYLMAPVVKIPYAARVPSDNVSAIFIGSFNGRKRGRMALQAVDAVRRAGLAIELRVVAPESDRDLWPPDTNFLAGLPDAAVQAAIRSSWVLLAPSEYEGFGIPTFEGLAMGVPVVATQNPGSIYLDGLVRAPSALRVVSDTEHYANTVVERLLGGANIDPEVAEQVASVVERLVEESSVTYLVRTIYGSLRQGHRPL